jgi:hypothetical protein
MEELFAKTISRHMASSPCCTRRLKATTTRYSFSEAWSAIHLRYEPETYIIYFLDLKNGCFIQQCFEFSPPSAEDAWTLDRKREKKTVGVAFLNRKLLPVSSAGEQSCHRPPRASKLIYQWSLDYTVLTN